MGISFLSIRVHLLSVRTSMKCQRESALRSSAQIMNDESEWLTK